HGHPIGRVDRPVQANEVAQLRLLLCQEVHPRRNLSLSGSLLHRADAGPFTAAEYAGVRSQAEVNGTWRPYAWRSLARQEPSIGFPQGPGQAPGSSVEIVSKGRSTLPIADYTEKYSD